LLNWNVIVEEQSSVVKPGFKRMQLNEMVERNADLFRQLNHSSELEQGNSKLVFAFDYAVILMFVHSLLFMIFTSVNGSQF